MTNTFDRRTFLARGAATAAGVTLLGGGASGLLAACGSSAKKATSSSGGSSSTNFGSAGIQFSWIKNVEFAGSYIADTKGFYKDEGFDKVNLVSGGPNVSTEPVIVSGKSLIGISSSPDFVAAAVANGAPLTVVGCLFQKNPFAVMSLAKSPINTPQDMKGKKIGVQATNETIWKAFLKANKLDPGSITKVPVQFDPSPLVSGDVDGWFSFVTNEPNLLKIKHVDTKTFLLDDFGYPLFAQSYVVKTDNLKGDARKKLKAFLRAEIRGWQESVKDPQLGADLAANKYGKGLGLTAKEQVLESAAQNKLIVSAETKVHGIMHMSDERIKASIHTMSLGGVKAKTDLFDNSLLDEIFDGKASI